MEYDCSRILFAGARKDVVLLMVTSGITIESIVELVCLYLVLRACKSLNARFMHMHFIE